MALGLYSEPKDTALISSDAPFTVTFDGRTGGQMDQCVYLRNDNLERWYDSIVISISDDGSTDHTDDSEGGWWWKLIQKDIQPANVEWLKVSAGNSLTIDADIGSEGAGDIVTYIPIWVRVSVPRSQPIQTIESIVFTVEATEHAA